MNLTVTTTSGTFEGTTSRDTRRWSGIPYAHPPVGADRFQTPRPFEAPTNNDPLPATRFSNPVPQFNPMGDGPKRTEDPNWLTVNVWAPLEPVENAPVMVWIHGGAYVEGSAANPLYMGAVFAQMGVVFVSVNYRLGIEGFMEFPDAPSNRGLLDQAQALRWVRENAQAFGGDPANVTVFGESAGAGSIHCLLVMPEAQGLCDRAILQSPPAMVLEKELAQDVTAEFAAHAAQMGLPVTEPTAQSFANLTPEQGEELMVAFSQGQGRYFPRWGKAAAFTPPLVPVVDGTVLPADPWSLSLPDGVDVLVGHTRDEFRLFTNLMSGEVTKERAYERVGMVGPGSQLLEDAQGDTGDLEAAQSQARELSMKYVKALGDVTPEQLFEWVQTDYMFTVPTLLVADAAQKRGAPAYSYLLAVDPDGGMGSPHVADLPPLFGSFRSFHGKLLYPNPSDADHALGQRMREAWVQFARTGDPGWEPWTREQPTTRVFGHEDRTRAHPFMDRFTAFDHAPSRALPLLGSNERAS
ncbi:para-nitrobenzyl esterase [Brevibacterium paucivorans]|uniref:Carboxylic ester hydrolase n=1 Tax=Brevibacterium paucivorans TaxID=170994 RepID=A0ABS2SLX3_9MICO|nr:carboxylesterase family protein [Brevibacterium paucivorans]MBM7816599.1 para-nitrobenzyl esterase [Brevibacterium paucivorans]